MKKRPASAISSSPVRIACLGDSNTVGGGLGRLHAYPALLQKHLDLLIGAGVFEVKGFGVNGATAANTSGKKCYMKQTRFIDAQAFQAHICVIMLGTNDAWHLQGEPDKVSSGILALIERLRGDLADDIGTTSLYPQFILVLPPGEKPGRLRENLRNVVHPALRALAKTFQQPTQLKRREHYFKVVLVEPPLDVPKSYRADLVHLSSQGAEATAHCISSAIQKAHNT
eukprot:TRINITY_DN67319_c0_g1_i1.p1 TRINITY_DN67319_c0_g1~~TRINITY_DN67319_c0_g1_i1.p1  ORF type:complete len:227 (-),score=16.00 TRINITY_DN67319_c0_g1_i1:139-819(-)